jgi:hypothetical protein
MTTMPWVAHSLLMTLPSMLLRRRWAHRDDVRSPGKTTRRLGLLPGAG